MNVAFDLKERSKARSDVLSGLGRFVRGDRSDASLRYQLFVHVVPDEREKTIARKYRLDQLTVWKGPESFSNDTEGRNLRSYPYLVVGTQLFDGPPFLLLTCSTLQEAESGIRAFSKSLRAYRLRIMDFDYDAELTPIQPSPEDGARKFSI